MQIERVGVVGCGLMGAGITQICAQSGYQVVVSEINDELLNKGLASINSFFTRNVKRAGFLRRIKRLLWLASKVPLIPRTLLIVT